MGTFGEIVEPTSRAVWEDWEDINPEHFPSDLQWERDPPVPTEVDTFLIFEGKYLSDCVQMQTQNKIQLINSVPQANLQLFTSKFSDKYICTIKDYNLVWSSEIIELLKPYLLVSKDVVAIQTKALNEYQATESTNDCVIRIIGTTKPPTKSLDISFPKLEQPNIISGVSAGVITLREHLDLSATALACYMECSDEYYNDKVEKLLEKLNIAQKSTSRPSSVLNSNLYM